MSTRMWRSLSTNWHPSTLVQYWSQFARFVAKKLGMKSLPRKQKPAARQMRITKHSLRQNAKSGRKYGAKKCVSKKNLRTSKSASMPRKPARSVNWNDKGRRKRELDEKRLMNNGGPIGSVYAKSSGHSMSSEIESARKDTNGEDEKIAIVIVNTIVIAVEPETETEIVIALTAVSLRAAGIQSENHLGVPEIRLRRQLLQ